MAERRNQSYPRKPTRRRARKKNQRARPAGSQEGRHVHQGAPLAAGGLRGRAGLGGLGAGGGGVSFIRGAYGRGPGASTTAPGRVAFRRSDQRFSRTASSSSRRRSAL